VAQNFLPVVLSFPHLVQRIALPPKRARRNAFCITRPRLTTSRLRKDDHDTSRHLRAEWD
jgi:hypothetical protein